MESTTSNDKSKAVNPWKSYCRELAAWTWERLAIKKDRHGMYSASGGAEWSFSEVTKDELAAHFAGDFTLGLGATSLDDQCLWVAWDLDNHESDEAKNQNLDYAIILMNRLVELGFKPIVEDSDGKGGIHVWVLFTHPIPAATAHHFSEWIARDYAERLETIECFPKNTTVQHTAAKCGHYLRTPGKHHKRDHWSRFWGDGEWLDLEESVQLLLSQTGDDPALIPSIPESPPEIKTEPYRPVYMPSGDERDIVVQALHAIPNNDIDYDDWLKIGMALHACDATLLDEFQHWSSCSQKHDASTTAAKWKSFSSNGKVQPGTIIHLAKQAGWNDPRKGSTSGVNIDGILNQKKRTRPTSTDYVPFPIEILPPVLTSFVRAVSAAIGCDAAFVVLPALAACGAAIGNTRRLMLKRGWFVPSILWCISIGESGTQKSPGQRAVISSLKKRQQDQLSEFNSAMAAYKADMRQHKAALKKQEKTGGDVPDEPQRPICERCVVSDVTLEGLVPILRDNWRGVMLARDELVGWIGSFDRYAGRGSASADAAHWLSIYNAESIVVDRKTGDAPSVFVPDAAVSICGGIQPGILNKALSTEHRENGLMARLLVAYPPRQPKQWRDDEIPQAVEDAFSDLLNNLFSLKPDTGADGYLKPALVRLDDAAREIVKNYVNANGIEQSGLTGDLAAAWSKLEETPARLALIVHCIRFVSGERVDPWTCDAASMEAGVMLATWFKNEIERVYRMLSEPSELRQLRQLAEWIKHHGGRVRARDVVSGRREIKTAEAAEELLTTLVNAGFGEWKTVGGERGQRTREFVLSD